MSYNQGAQHFFDYFVKHFFRKNAKKTEAYTPLLEDTI
jgi:hypothetical protein